MSRRHRANPPRPDREIAAFGQSPMMAGHAAARARSVCGLQPRYDGHARQSL